jgi:hypothetical protein
MIMAWWALLIAVVSLVVAVTHEFVALRKYHARWERIERIAADTPSRLHIIDRSVENGVIEIIIDHSTPRREETVIPTESSYS